MGNTGEMAVIKEPLKGITKISVKGFKSLIKNNAVEIRPLTILAGANNSGKSSIMQPLLMMKQTLEEVYEPGSDLLISGSHIKFGSSLQFLSKVDHGQLKRFTINIELDGKISITDTFRKNKDKPIQIDETIYESENETLVLRSGMTQEELIEKNPFYKVYLQSLTVGFDNIKNDKIQNLSKDLTLKEIGIGLCVRRKRCLLGVAIDKIDPDNDAIFDPVFLPLGMEQQQKFENYILDIIHVPANRDNPERSYVTTSIGKRIKGPINDYVASIIYYWKESGSYELEKLGQWLNDMGLTSKVDASQIDDARVKILVNRLCNPGKNCNEDMLNITDVGFGISQVLPVLVALLIAKKNQLVYIEEPEIHLHPKAQYKIAEYIAESVERGVRVIVETHSEMLLINMQTLVAKKIIPSEDVILHWFKRNKDGSTNIRKGKMDNIGAYGDWPVDFSDFSFEANKEYLKATGFKLGK
jgi:predicted ATPase